MNIIRLKYKMNVEIFIVNNSTSQIGIEHAMYS